MLLQVPMEPFDYPDNDPGPQTLLMSLSAEQNIDRLHWLMSRFQGYVGITNYMGARFTATEQALAPVLKETGKRGLIYFDDGSSPRSLAGQIAGANNLPFAKAEIVLDAVPTPAHIDRALTRLEAMARERGVAVGVASAVPASIERIAQWAKAAGEPRRRAGADQRGRDQAEVELTIVIPERTWPDWTPRHNFLDSAANRCYGFRPRPMRARPNDRVPYAPLRRPALPSLRRAVRASTARASCSSAAASAAPSTSTRRTSGRCRRAASTRARSPIRRRCANCYEETNIRSVEKLGEIKGWLTYDIPRDIVGKAWGGKYRGQKQKWYALRFTGKDSEIDIANPAGGHDPEFVEWRWEPMENLPDLVVPFKRTTYERVVKAFSKFAKPTPASAARQRASRSNGAAQCPSAACTALS